MYSKICTQLTQEIAVTKHKIEETEANQITRRDLTARIEGCEKNIRYCERVKDRIAPALKDIIEYIADKRSKSEIALNQALMVAASVVPDSMKGIKFTYEKEEAYLSVNGIDVDKIEGSGYKSAISMLTQAIVVKSNPLILQSIAFDEVLSKLSPKHSLVMSAYMPILAENLQVILIEQKPEVFSNIPGVCTYHFTKSEDYTRVVKESVA